METKQYKKQDGALWVKKTKSGDAFFSFEIEDNGVKKKYVAWKNKRKMMAGANPKLPDFQIYLDTYAPAGRTPAQELADDSDCPY
jgi:hypothetical protein